MSAIFGAKEAIEYTTQFYRNAATASYPTYLIETLRRLADFDIYSVTIFSPSARPRFVHSNLEEFVSIDVITKFLAGTYLLDAAYTACCERVAPGLYRLCDLAPDNYFSSDFYNSADFHPCVSEDAGSLAEEIVYMAQAGDDYLVISLMRTNDSTQFDDQEFERLRLMEPVVLETALKHWGSEVSGSPTPALGIQSSTLERAFGTFAIDSLSPREQTIVSLLLRGHSTLSVAHNLEIAEGTAKVHRRNIYEKLGITSQAELFLMFCSHVIKSDS